MGNPGEVIVNIGKEVPASAKKGATTKILLASAAAILVVASLVVMSGTSVPSLENQVVIDHPASENEEPPMPSGGSESEHKEDTPIKVPKNKPADKKPAEKPSSSAKNEDKGVPGCAKPKMLYNNQARELPTCKMPALMAPRRKLYEDNAAGEVSYPDVLKRFPFSSDFFRPPQRGSKTNQMSECFVPYNETEFQNYCSNDQSNIVVPDRLVFFFIQDRGEWEREPLVDHIAPFILNARMRDYHSLDEFSTEEDYKAYLRDYHVNKTVMTIHLSFEGEIKDAQSIVKSFVETVDCVLQHMRMWYTPKQIDTMLGTVRGAIMVGEFFTSPKNLDMVFQLVDMYRTGKSKLDVTTGLVTSTLDNGTTIVGQYPPNPKEHKWETDTPHAPVTVPPGTPFVLPEFTTSYGTSDEFLGNIPIATYTAKWRMLSPNTRSYLRQYAPKLMRNDSDPYAPYIEHVMSGFRHYGKESLSPEKSLAIKATERKYLWSFLGDLKSDRREMSEIFKKWGTELKRDFHCCGGSEEVRSFYLQSTFVPVGRGHANLDCFRIYEAAGSGAIPVIVGSREEVYDTFGHFITSNNYLPPFIFETSWEKAAAEANRLINSPNELLRKQKAVVAWFFKNFWHMQKKITALQ